MQHDAVSVVILRVAHRFQQRFIEWLASFQIMFMGIVLLGDGDTLNPDRFPLILQWAPENIWGIVFFIVGASRLGGLIVNGSKKHITPWIRAAGAFLGMYVFGVLGINSLSVWLAGNPAPLGLAIYFPAVVAEIVSIYYSAQDAKAYRDGSGNT